MHLHIDAAASSGGSFEFSLCSHPAGLSQQLKMIWKVRSAAKPRQLTQHFFGFVTMIQLSKVMHGADLDCLTSWFQHVAARV